MVKRKQRLSAECPHCNLEETALHMPTCQSTEVSNFWQATIQSLQTWLTNQDTEPNITTFLCKGLLSWTQDPHGNEILFNNIPVPAIIPLTNQLAIGWFGTLSGLIHPSIISLQQQHYTAMQSRRTGSAWGHRLIRQLWQYIFDLWKLRNHTLHENPMPLGQGVDHLNFSIQVEYFTGPIGLPKHYKDFFTVSLTTLLAKPIEQRKQWFRLIRKAREIRKLPIQDAFTTNVILRNWVHLPRTHA